MALRVDCVYYESMRPDQYRGWCNKLNKLIKARDCQNCGWYILKNGPESFAQAGKRDLDLTLSSEAITKEIKLENLEGKI